jgi:four helix bundle protein
MQRFTDLRVWQLAHTYAIDIYKTSASFPEAERFGLTAQLRRAAVSVSSNIAEGSKRRSEADYARFLNLAEGSLAESESLLLLARDLGMTPEERVTSLLEDADSLARMLAVLRSKVEAEARTARS